MTTRIGPAKRSRHNFRPIVKITGILEGCGDLEGRAMDIRSCDLWDYHEACNFVQTKTSCRQAWELLRSGRA